MAGPRVVVDTNVLVSAVLSSLRGREHSPSFLIFSSITAGGSSAPVLLVSTAILDEYAEVLSRPQFGIAEDVIQQALNRIQNSSETIVPASRLETPDADDSPFLECALDGRADYLITGNKRHFPNWTIIVTPREFLERGSK